MQAENDDDLYGGQRSSEFKYGNLCVKGHQSSNMATYVLSVPYLAKRIADAS